MPKNCNSYNGRDKKTRTTMQKMERWRRRGLTFKGNKRQAVQWREIVGNGGRLYWKEGAQLTVVLDEENRNKESST
jgi:hypothetical protein